VNQTSNGSAGKVIRGAVYTRKSTEEGQRQFTSLDAQREAGEAYIASQQHEGWLCLPERYDDGGFTGGNMDRPALARLLTEIRAGKVDCVVVYKVDRLSRSLLDFAKMMETFDKHHISFVSVTQQFNTATSMGRLVLNILLSFAQFEREIISERTRDKIAATRRKGKWTGGPALLGYDLDSHAAKLKANPKEAARVRAIFELYLQHRSLETTVQELARRRWRTKRRQNRDGDKCGGRRFTRPTLHRLLTNVTYTGKVRYQNEVYAGEQPALVPLETWQRVQDLLKNNRGSVRGRVENRSGALLQGLLYCTACACAMTPTSSIRGGKRYRYYLCCGAHRRGRQSCPAKSIPAWAIEETVLKQIQTRDPNVDVRTEAPSTQLRLVRLWIGRVDYDAAQNKVAITFNPTESSLSSAKPADGIKETNP
jgi:site-specific DNA recombinase